MQPKGIEDLAAFTVKKVKRAAEEKERDKISLQKDSESQSKKQSHSSFLKIEGKGTFVGEKDWREKDSQ